MYALIADLSAKERNTWMLVALAGATILYAIFRPTGKKKDPLRRIPASATLSQQRNVERQMESLLVELSTMARQITAQLDTRSAKLEALIQEADQKIAALRAAGENARPGGGSMTIASHQPEWPASPPPPSRPTAPPVEVDPRHEEVYSLADGGTETMEIARRLNRPRGEVELILALRPRG